MSREVALQISRPSILVQHRLSDDTNKTIVLGGVRHWPRCLTEKWPRFLKTVHWRDHQLHLWQGDLRDVPYYLVPSEMTDTETGRTGRLVVTPQVYTAEDDDPGQPPREFDLWVEGVDHPGTYEGVLAIYSPDGKEYQRLKVVARVRDSLVWPSLVITLGALVIGLLLRVGVGDSRRSVPFLRVRIARARRRLGKIPACSVSSQKRHRKCEYVEHRLQKTEDGLSIRDLDQAEVYLKQAEVALDELEEASYRLAIAGRELEEAEGEGKVPKGKLQKAREKWESADRHYWDGDFAEVDKLLDKMYDCLETEISEDMDDEKRRQVLLDKWDIQEGQIGWEPLSLERIRRDARGIPIFYTDETVTFYVVGGDGPRNQGEFTWKIEPQSQDEQGQSETGPLAKFEYKIEAQRRYDYPRIYRVIAESPSIGLQSHTSFEVRHPYEIVPERTYAGQPAGLALAPVHSREQPPAKDGIVWQRRIADCWWPEVPASYRPWFRGKRRIAAKVEVWNPDGKCWETRLVAARELRVVTDPVGAARNRLVWYSGLASLAWAGVAGLIGLIYIADRVPAFGSWEDYLIAFAWGLSVSTAATPKEGIWDEVRKVLGIKPGEQVEVPDLVKLGTKAKAREELERLGLEPEWEREGKDDWRVTDQRPEAGKQVKKGSVVTVNLQDPGPAEPDKDTIPPLKNLTKTEAAEKLAGLGLEPKWEPEGKDDWKVLRSKPAAGEPYEKGDTVTVYLDDPTRPFVENVDVDEDDGKVVVTLTGRNFARGKGLRIRLGPKGKPDEKRVIDVRDEDIQSAMVTFTFEPTEEEDDVKEWEGIVEIDPDEPDKKKESDVFEVLL
jgi:hypothetical protein